MDEDERKRIQAEYLAGITNEIANNPNYEAEYAAMIPDLIERMTAIVERFPEPKDRVEHDIVHLAKRDLAFLASQLFAPGVLKDHMN